MVKIEEDFKVEIMKKYITYKYVVAGILIAFALVTLFMSGAVLFDLFGVRASQGNYVPFIVKTNLTAGFLYLIAAYGFVNSKKWAPWAMLSIALLLFYALALFYLHMHSGGLYENRTLVALIFRIVFTLVFAALLNVNTTKKT